MGVAFASLWLALAAVPCGALEELGVDMGHSHAVAQPVEAGERHDCPHCPGDDRTAGAVAASPSDCNGTDDAVVAKTAKADLVLAAAPTSPFSVPLDEPGRSLSIVRRGHDRPPAVPLNVRYCTFLE